MARPPASWTAKAQLSWPRHRRRSAAWMALGTAILAAAALTCIWGAGQVFPGWAVGYRAQYATVVVLIVAWMTVVGKAFNGHLEGLLIDGRNRISLSRLQLFVWLVVVGCAFAVEVAHNFHVHSATPDDLKVPVQLGLVMGAATTSFVASPAILSMKARAQPSPAELRNAHRFARDGSSLHPNSGRLYSRNPGERARWSDIFRGEELETAGSADPAKVQQFLVTFLLVAIYLAALWRDLAMPVGVDPFKQLPGLSTDGLILLGASHAAYLGGKAAPQTPGGPASGPGADMPRVDTAPQPDPSGKPPPEAPAG
jgi:hypothetical protein